jgi:EAL domain-containing protein (putative c-di-GMP-specific phosphodiesterase class I)
LSELAKLPVPALKLDCCFIIDMPLSPEDLALVSGIVVVELVEAEEQFRRLRVLSCGEMWGYLLGRRLPREILDRKKLGHGNAGATSTADA